MIKICTSGVITPMGNSETEIWDNLLNGRAGTINQKLEYKSSLPKKVQRRTSRFADLAATAAINCFEELKKIYEIKDINRVGCVFTTDYGPIDTNLDFARQIIKDDPDACSPIVFSNTVHNACLGTIAINLGITGPSTMLLGSNPFMFCEMIMEENKADFMLVGSAEEFNNELKESMITFKHSSRDYSDAAVVLAIVNDENNRTGVQINKTVTLNLGVTPFEEKRIDYNELSNIIRTKIGSDVDAVIINDQFNVLGDAEKCIFNEQFPAVAVIDKVYNCFGNCLGSDMGIKMLLAKLILEKNIIPECLQTKPVALDKLSHIAILSTDITGNYYITILEK